MPSAESIVIFFWLFFIAYWAVSAVGVKKDVTKSRSWGGALLLRILIIVAIVWVLNTGFFPGFWASASSLPIFANATVKAIGVILCATGIAFAIWARRHLGRNWSGSPQMKEDHELVTSGPYRFVRHPIYTGMIAALFGSALVGGPGWFAAFIIFAAVFILRIKKEEGYMMQLFPGQYPGYRKRTKALIPFIW
ncbi:MAG TPA: isoprenylcysteine carboxylmethyltransferase family protein [Candidatus Paceibacterota bacterium]|nr:isoprenylcysteine carboxylmethyltransferase family protein [Candidatus Paceibacterota bacterium]